MANLIEKYPVPVILKKIHKEKFSGHLNVKGKGFSKTLYFIDGDPRSVSSTYAKDRLGEILYSNGKISRRQLDTLGKAREKSNVKFGKLLVENNILSHRDLYNALQDQMRTIALSMFALTSGEWSFSSKASNKVEDKKFEMSLPQLLLHGSQHIKDFSYYENRFGNKVPKTLEIPEHIGQLLSADEVRFYVNMTKSINIPCNEILKQMEIPEPVFWQKVVLMYLLDILEFKLFKAGRDSNWKPATDSDVYRTMQYNTPRSTEAELTDIESVCEKSGEYFSYSKKELPVENIMEYSARPHQPTVEETEVPVETTEKKPEPPPSKEQKDSAPKPYLLFSQAQTLYKERKFFKALRLLEDAVRLAPEKASYIQLLGLCQLRIPSYRPYAEKNLQKAAQLEPWNPDPLFYLGQLYWTEKLYYKAETYFKKTLDVNPKHTQAKNMLLKVRAKYGKKALFSIFGKK